MALCPAGCPRLQIHSHALKRYCSVQPVWVFKATKSRDHSCYMIWLGYGASAWGHICSWTGLLFGSRHGSLILSTFIFVWLSFCMISVGPVICEQFMKWCVDDWKSLYWTSLLVCYSWLPLFHLGHSLYTLLALSFLEHDDSLVWLRRQIEAG